MLEVAILIGIYSYFVFALGLLGFLYKPLIIFSSILFFTIVFLLRKKLLINLRITENIQNFIKNITKFEKFLLLLIGVQIFINLIGVLGPEYGFDALWYHLTIPKIYLFTHEIVHIPGSLFYYSDMPKLTEMLYVSALSFGNEITAKLIHFSFGILTLVAIYKLSRMFLSKTFSLLVATLFYSNLVVGWMSITAYVDLARTFFEVMTLWAFMKWYQRRDRKWLISSSIILGLAISTKLLALGSLFIFTALIIYISLKVFKNNLKLISANILVYLLIALLISIPWFVFSFIHTGNPFYPFFTSAYPVKFNFDLINPLSLSDPISPLYVITIPLAIIFYKKFNQSLRLVSLYSFLAIIIWYMTPQTGGGRFILPYLPVLSLISLGTINIMKKNLQYIFIILIICLALFSIMYRLGANIKYLPVILGKETKSSFLSDHLNFSFGDFYDTDGYLAKTISNQDRVLLYGFHNLYYVNFPFIDSTYVKKGDMFNYIVDLGNNLPERFKIWNLVYFNPKTNLKLYSAGRMKWAY